MQTILYQGKPEECHHWVTLPKAFVASVQNLRYVVRELVARVDAEAAKEQAYNDGIERAAALAQVKSPAMANLIRELKVKP